jgi:hypothetical protein
VRSLAEGPTNTKVAQPIWNDDRDAQVSAAIRQAFAKLVSSLIIAATRVLTWNSTFLEPQSVSVPAPPCLKAGLNRSIVSVTGQKLGDCSSQSELLPVAA